MAASDRPFAISAGMADTCYIPSNAMFRASGLSLFLTAFLVYNLNCRPIPTGDSTATALLPFRIVSAARVDLDPWAAELRERYGPAGSYFLVERGGHFYSFYPVALPVLLSPLYLPVAGAARLPLHKLLLLARVLEKILASALAAAGAAVMLALLSRLTTRRRASALAVVYAFGTNIWATASQALWQHTGSQLAIALSIYGLARFLEDSARERFAWLAGGAAALSVAFRPTDLLFYAASLGVICLRARRPVLLAAYLLPGALTGTALAAYNLGVFGHLNGAYGPLPTGNFGAGLLGVLFSPGRGLFVYTPVALFAVFCFRGWNRHATLYTIAALFTLTQVAVISRWPMWWGGACYGPRLLVDMLPCLVLLLTPALDAAADRPLLRRAFLAAALLSASVQSVGVFCYPKGHAAEDLWNLRRSPILTNFRAGPVTWHYPILARWSLDVLRGRMPETSAVLDLIR
jgi:hypothetical protein